MSRRGRKTGLKNFSLEERKRLCDNAKKILPLGGNMWEQVALRFNSERPRGAPMRDFEALRRKFRTMYSTKKPSGVNGEFTEAEELIRTAHEIHRDIELKAGVHTSHDGSDAGEDDEELDRHVHDVTNNPSVAESRNDSADEDYTRDEGGGGFEDDREDQEESQHSVPGDEAAETQTGPSPHDERVHSEEMGLLQAPAPPAGAIYTAQGFLPVEFAPDVDGWPGGGEEDQQGDESAEGTIHLNTTTADSSTPRAATGLPTVNPTTEVAATPTQGNTTPEASARASTPRSNRVGRPRRGTHEPLLSTATPDGRPLSRDPRNIASDEVEAAQHDRLSSTSNRLGGQDLRVLRDNFQQMGGRTTSKEKRAAPDGPAPNNYAQAKRFRARQRMESLDRELEAAAALQRSNGTDMLQMLLFFKEEAIRKAEAEDARRRQEREERREEERLAKEQKISVEQRQRENRERERREEMAEAEARRVRMEEEARVQREEKEQKEKEAREERDEERRESRRRFEQRLELDRDEARQRHEQMMLLISTILQKKD